MRAGRLKWKVVLALVVPLSVMSASPQATAAGNNIVNAYVALEGADDGLCAIAAPCRTLQHAYENIADRGQIFIRGPYQAGPLTADRPVSIIGLGAGVFFSGFPNALLVANLADTRVLIRNVDFYSRFDSYGGVFVRGSGKLTIENARFESLPGAAVNVRGAAGTRVTLENVRITGSAIGVSVSGAGGAANVVFIQNSFIDANTQSAVKIDGSANAAVLIGSTLSGSGQVDLSLVNGGRAISYRNNIIRSGTPTQSLPLN